MNTSSSDTNPNLLLRLNQGDESALVEIYKQFWQPLFISAYNILKDKESCEDILQNLFINLWNKREQLQIHTSLEAYLHTAVRYRVFTYIRDGKKIREFMENFREPEHTPSPEVELLRKEIEGQVHDIINQLPDRCKAIYKLSREQQLSHQEIATKLGLSKKTVENQITIALRRIREGLGMLAVFILYWVFH